MRRYRILSILILIVLLFNNCIVFAETLDQKYANAKKRGDTLGYSEGRSKATQIKSIEDLKSSVDLRPKEEDIVKKYSSYLANNDKNFEAYFITGYYEGFDRGYYEVIYARFGITVVEPEITYADAFGLLYGELYAGKDYYNGTVSNWLKALPTDTTIIELFSLKMETTSYRAYFLKTFKQKFKEGYETGYEKSLQEPKSVSLDAGISDGEELGSNLGMVYGTKDYYERKTNNYKRNMPSDSTIGSNYALNMDSSQYKEGFLIGFKRGYEESYNEAFRAANVNLKLLDDADGFENGYNIGSIKGEILATKDYTMKKPSDWKKNGISNTEIIREHLLILQTDNYRQGFISGYWQGLSEVYIATYKSLSQEDSVAKSTIMEIPISGGLVLSGDNGLAVQIDHGTYYNKVALTINSLLDSSYELEDKYIKASNYYKIEIINSTNNYDNSTPITLSFEYYGKQNGGIYKLVNNKWMYLPSNIEEGKITTKVEPKSLNSKSGIYAVLIDTKTPILPDIRGHWAKDEINTYVRRGFIAGYSDKTFKPNRNITRAEFLTILSRVYDWELSNDVENIKLFKDFEKFKGNDKVISYAYKNKYIKGYGDNTFRPSDFISYEEVEIIMRRVYNDDNINWYYTASKMLYDKKIRCASFDSKDNKITRAEFVYMLYLFTEWKY